jgi:hypothetical protein
LILAPIAYVVSIIVAALVIAIGLYGALPDAGDPAGLGFFFGLMISLILNVGALSFLPALVAVAVAEIFRIRSILYFLAIGGALGLAADQLTGFAMVEPRSQMLVVLLAGGFTGGLVYWLIAGRLAGIGARDTRV